jgi:hypothetical protein
MDTNDLTSMRVPVTGTMDGNAQGTRYTPRHGTTVATYRGPARGTEDAPVSVSVDGPATGPTHATASRTMGVHDHVFTGVSTGVITIASMIVSFVVIPIAQVVVKRYEPLKL